MGSLLPASKSPGRTSPPQTKMMQLLVISLSVTVSVGQVNQEIYSEEDLLAIDSETFNTVVVAPPPSLPLQANSIQDEPEVNVKTERDGSHSFRWVWWSGGWPGVLCLSCCGFIT